MQLNEIDVPFSWLGILGFAFVNLLAVSAQAAGTAPISNDTELFVIVVGDVEGIRETSHSPDAELSEIGLIDFDLPEARSTRALDKFKGPDLLPWKSGMKLLDALAQIEFPEQ